MKIIEPNEDELIVESSPNRARIAIVIIIALWLVFMFKIGRGLSPLFFVSLAFGAWAVKGFIFGSAREKYLFDRRSGELRWERRRIGKTRSGTIPFGEIQKIAHREIALRESSFYELIITSIGRNPMIIGSTNDVVQYERVAQRIRQLLGREALSRDGIAGPLVVSESLTSEEEASLE
jgi:hypothetical protein